MKAPGRSSETIFSFQGIGIGWAAVGTLNDNVMSTAAQAPIGKLILLHLVIINRQLFRGNYQKHHLQVSQESVSTPPSRGPTTLEQPNVTPSTPM